MQQLIILLLPIVMFTASCGWHPRNTVVIPSLQVRQVIFDPIDTNSPLNQAIRNELRNNGFKLINKKDYHHQDILSFHTIDSFLGKERASIFLDGRTAEYQIILLVNATIQIPGQKIYQINTQVCRSFLDDPQAVLAKVTEQQLIINEMYNKAAKQLIYKLQNTHLNIERCKY